MPNHSTETMPLPLGGEVYVELNNTQGSPVVLTYNDLWLLIVCRTSLDGDWQRTREAAGMVPDPSRKRALVDRLWQLEREFGGLPNIPENVMSLNLHRAHQWFNNRSVSDVKTR